MIQGVIDRIEGRWAVIELANGDKISLPVSLIEVEIREGDVVSLSVSVNKECTKERRMEVEQKGKRLLQRRRNNV